MLNITATKPKTNDHISQNKYKTATVKLILQNEKRQKNISL